MNIVLTHGTGTGPTEMAAFDAALLDAGVANYNLLYLSSILPPGSNVYEQKPKLGEYGDWGDRLYVVMSQQRSFKINEEAWAGIGWFQDETGKGMLVEHEGLNESTVRADISNSLTTFAKNRKMKFGQINMVVTGITCVKEPVCAMAIAVFEGSSWRNAKQPNPMLGWIKSKPKS